LEIYFRRIFDPKGDLRIVERSTGMEFRCKTASQRMFGETWRDHDYDVPRVLIRPGDLVIDIGGNHGFYTCYAAHFGARVIVFEPTPALFESLQENVRKNGLETQVKTCRQGVSNRAGTQEMILTDSLGGGMNTIVTEFAEKTQMIVADKISIELTTLEAIFAENQVARVRVCKLDCEGAELMILKEISVETARKVDAFVIEYHPPAYAVEDLIRLILSWGTHQVSYAEDKYCPREILRAVRNDLLV
jgi:FkbM family methyltransferase